MPEPCKIKELSGKKYRCFFELTFQVIGGKWKIIILFHLAQAGKLRFGELKKSIPDITERMLTKQLRELEADDMVHREVYKQVPPKVEYSLTEFGQTIIPVLNTLRSWGIDFERHMGGTEKFSGPGYESPEAPCIAPRYLRDAEK